VLNNIVVTGNKILLSLNDNFVCELESFASQLSSARLTQPFVVELKLTEVKIWGDNTNKSIDSLVGMFKEAGCVALSATILENQLDIMPEAGNVLINDPHNSTRVFFNSDSASRWLAYEVSKNISEGIDTIAA
tara:strand:- start:656 stop:1054 length:399 start_codon:yes stop_codon:yes gene_type:complete